METDRKPRRIGHYETLEDGRTVFMRPTRAKRTLSYDTISPPAGRPRLRTGLGPMSVHDLEVEKQSPEKQLTQIQEEAEATITKPYRPALTADKSPQQQ